MRIVVAGSTGLLGTRLTEELRGRGHTLTRLVRRPAQSADESCWDPHAGQIDDTVIHAADAVVNCAGSRLFGIPQSSGWQRSMVDSRVNTTRVLAESIARAGRPPAFLACNGSSYYGDHGAEPVTEESDSRGDAFMTRVTKAWQGAADPAVAAGARVCIVRSAPVMTRGGDTLGILEPLFRLGLGARLGDGTQYFPAVSLRDWIGAVTMLAEHPTASGPVNVCCPETPTNAEFTRAFAVAVHRPAFLFVPRWLLSVAAGPASPELLRSLNMRPAALEALGFEFADRDIESVMATALR